MNKEKKIFELRLKMIKFFNVLIVAAGVQIMLLPFAVVFPNHWWVLYIVVGIVAGLVHDPVSKYIEKNKD